MVQGSEKTKLEMTSMENCLARFKVIFRQFIWISSDDTEKLVFPVSGWRSEIGISRMGSRPAARSTVLCDEYLQNDTHTSHEINRLPLCYNLFNEL